MPSQQNKRILFVTRAYSEHSGGMERLSWEMINAISRLDSVDTQIIAHRGTRTMTPLFVLRAIPRVIRAARQADIIHLGDPLLSVHGWLIKKIYRLPVAVTVHGLDVTYANPLYRVYLKLFFSHFDLYLPISRHANHLLQQKRVTGQRRVVRPGVNDRFFDDTIKRQALSKLLTCPLDNHSVILTTGRLVRRKGHTWFISQVLPHLPASILYVIAGSGPEHDRILNAARQQGVAQRVILLGRVNHHDLKILYNTVDAYIQPNIHVTHDSEGFGLVLLEAALCQRPVFAADIDGIADAIQHGKNGRLLPMGKPQAWIAELTSYLKQKQDHPPTLALARQYTLQHFSWGQAASRYLRVLGSVIPAAK